MLAKKKICFCISQHCEKADLRHGQSFYRYSQSGLHLPNWNPVMAEWVQVFLLPDTEYFGQDIKDKYYGIHCKVNWWGISLSSLSPDSSVPPLPQTWGPRHADSAGTNPCKERELTESNISCLQNTLTTNHSLSPAVTGDLCPYKVYGYMKSHQSNRAWDIEWGNPDILSSGK